MKKTQALIVLSILFISMTLVTGAVAGVWHFSNSSGKQPTEAFPEGEGLKVVRIYYNNQEQLVELTSWLAPWEVHPDDGYIVVDVDRYEYNHLLESGFRLEIEEKLTELLNRPNEPLPGQISGIPNYPCYRTVEETYATAEQISSEYPHLASWSSIGYSWEKITPGGEPGYDIMLLKLTNENTTFEKGKLFIMAAVHAREYTTAELATRFAEYLVQNYDTDPDVTWILDHNEIHLVLQANPDGRKKAEAGLSWRKNTNNNYCTDSNNRGADLNRNFPFLWGGQGSSPNPCDTTYRGPWAASEPETQAIINYVRENFPDNREDDEFSPAPEDSMGIFIDLHSYSQLVLWPWGHVYSPAPNGIALQTLGRKFAYFNNYTPQQSVHLYPTTGTTDDFGYGELGLASYTFELGTSFFQSCSVFENTILPNNMPALLFAASASRLPYMEPAGPEPMDVTVFPSVAAPGDTIRISAVLDDTRYNNSEGAEPVQNIVEAEYYLNIPPWVEGAVAHPMTAVDGSFNSPVESVEAFLDITDLEQGRHIIFVRGKDAANNWGVVSAAFLYILDPETSPTIQGYVRSAGDNSPLEATISAGPFMALADAATGFYSLQVVSGEYTLTVTAPSHATTSLPGIDVSEYEILNQNIYLDPVCTVFFDDVESGNQGWTAQSPWSITTEASHSPTHSWTESPGGFYQNNRNITLTSQNFDLSDVTGTTLEFWHRYDLETGWDFGYVEYSTNGGVTWTTSTSYTGYGQTTWREESLPLTILDGVSNARFRFRFYSDSNTIADGWHIDDILLKAAGSSCLVPLPPEAAFLSTISNLQDNLVHFTDMTYGTPPFEYEWDFGDGVGVSNESDPSYTYPQPGLYTVTMAVSNDLGTSTAVGEVMISGGFNLNPLISEGWAVPGDSVLYSITLTNTSDITQSYLLELGDHEWESLISIDEINELPPDEAVEFEINVTIPGDVDGGSWESLALTVSLLEIPENNLVAQVTTHAHILPGLDVEAPIVEGQASPGESVSYTLVLTNTGNAGGDFLREVASTWETEVRYLEGEIIGPEDEISLARDESVSLVLTVSIPQDAAHGEQNLSSLTFVLQGDPSFISDPVEFTTTSLYACIEISSVSLAQVTSGHILPGDEVFYQAFILPEDANLPFSYTINMGDGSDPVAGQSEDNPMEFSHIFQDPGLYGVVIQVQNCSMVAPVSDILNTVVSFEGLELAPLVAQGSADPGETFTYSLTLINTSTIPQSILLSLGEHSWESWISTAEVVELQPEEILVFEINVTIPPDADGGSWESLELTISLVDNPQLSLAAEFTTTANTLLGMDVETPANEGQAFPGKSAIYTITLTNTGNINKNLLASVASEWLTEIFDQHGEVVAPDDVISLARGQSATLSAWVTVPLGASHGAEDDASLWFVLPEDNDFTFGPVHFKTQSVHHQLFLPFVNSK